MKKQNLYSLMGIILNVVLISAGIIFIAYLLISTANPPPAPESGINVGGIAQAFAIVFSIIVGIGILIIVFTLIFKIIHYCHRKTVWIVIATILDITIFLAAFIYGIYTLLDDFSIGACLLLGIGWIILGATAVFDILAARQTREHNLYLPSDDLTVNDTDGKV